MSGRVSRGGHEGKGDLYGRAVHEMEGLGGLVTWQTEVTGQGQGRRGMAASDGGARKHRADVILKTSRIVK